MVTRSVVAGLMWFSYGQKELALRHSCEHDDRLPRYGWLHHDGVMYGEQEIVDHGKYVLYTLYSLVCRCGPASGMKYGSVVVECVVVYVVTMVTIVYVP